MVSVLRRDRVLRTLTRPVLVPLFRDYLFVDIGSDPWVPVRYAPGVAALMMSGGVPNYVRADDVERLMAGEGRRRSDAAAALEWEAGMPCVLTAGPFTGLAAVILDAAEETARVTMLVFGELRDVTVPVAHLALPVT